MLELDPQIAKAIASEPSGRVVAETLSVMRDASIKPSASPSPGIERRDYTVEGDPAVVIRVHRPAHAEGPLPVVYSMHGGGYVLGSYATDDARLDGWAKSFGCIGVSVDYRLAPETPYPGPLDDCYRGLKWVFDHHDELGVDPDELPSPVIAGVASLLAFSCGALVPLFPYLVGASVLWVSLVLTGVALAGGGAVVGRLTGRPVLTSGLRQLALGGLAIAITFGVGHLIGSHSG